MAYKRVNKHIYLETDTGFWNLTGKMSDSALAINADVISRSLVGRNYNFVAATRISGEMSLDGILLNEPDPVLQTVMNTANKKVNILEHYTDANVFTLAEYVLTENSLTPDDGIWVMSGTATAADDIVVGTTVDANTPGATLAATHKDTLTLPSDSYDIANARFVMLINKADDNTPTPVELGGSHRVGFVLTDPANSPRQWTYDELTPTAFDSGEKSAFIVNERLTSGSDPYPSAGVTGVLSFYRDNSTTGFYNIASSNNILGYGFVARIN